MASLSTCHLGLWLGWQILLNLVKHEGTDAGATERDTVGQRPSLVKVLTQDDYTRGIA